MYYIILRVFGNHNLFSNCFSLNQEKTRELMNRFSFINDMKNKVEWVTLYYIGSNTKDNRIYNMKLKDISIKNGELKIEYESKKSKISDKNKEDFDKKLYGLLRNKGVIKGNEFIPNVVILDVNDKNQLNKWLNRTQTIKNNKHIEGLKRENDWQSIYNILGSIDDIKNSKEWNDAEFLSEIAFAASRLGFMGRIDKEILKDKDRRKEALKELNVYRENAKMLYERCIGIDRDNEARYLEGLGFIEYQYVLDCLNNRVEKIGNIIEAFNKAGEYYKGVLKIDKNKIKVLYRFGYLYVDKSKSVFRNDYRLVNKYQEEGISYLLNVIKLYESMENEDDKKRYRNEYLKAYYTIGSYYGGRSKLNFSKFRDVVLSGVYVTNERDYFVLNRAIDFLSKCFELQYGEDIEGIFKNTSINDIVKTYSNWTNEPIEVLYWLGVTYMGMYVYERRGNVPKDKLKEYVQKSETCFKYALRLNWKEQNKRTPKNYIEEKLARLYILTEEYDKAIKLLEKYEKRNGVSDYIVNTLLFAKQLANNRKTA